MRRTLAALFAGASLTALALSSASAEEVLYVRSLKAKVLASPQADAPVVATVARGTELALVARAGNWIHVDAADVRGWVSAFLVSDQPPIAKVSVLEAGSESLQTSARRRASSVATAGASRGLVADGDADENAQDPADYEALREMERMAPSADEVSEFLKGAQGQ